jgi:hypothetical protein
MLKRRTRDRRKVEIPDLPTQYEELLDTVWRCEQRARLMDRIEAQTRSEELQRKRCRSQR